MEDNDPNYDTHVINLSALMMLLWCKGFAESRLQGHLHCVQIRFLSVLKNLISDFHTTLNQIFNNPHKTEIRFGGAL